MYNPGQYLWWYRGLRWNLNLEFCSCENWDTELEIGKCFDAKNPARIFLKKLQTSHCDSGTFWKTHWIQSVEGNIWSSTAPQSHFVWIWAGFDFYEKFRALSDLKFNSRIPKSNWTKMDFGTDNKFLKGWKLIPILLVVLYCSIH